LHRAVFAVVVVALIALAFVSGLEVSTFLSENRTITITTGPSVTLVSSSTVSSNASGMSTTCELTAYGSVVLRVLNSSSDTPIGSVPVQVEYLQVPCPPNPQTTENLGVLKTNGSGIVSVGGLGEYYFRFPTYGSYSVNASIAPERVVCVTVSFPSAQLRINYSTTFSFKC
jgi:hypothetical protein